MKIKNKFLANKKLAAVDFCYVSRRSFRHFFAMKFLTTFLILVAMRKIDCSVFTSTDELEALVVNQQIFINELATIKEKFRLPADHFLAR